tara:strand:- start:3376 stop:3966 length:591 start_codon:yes stop_codon:yes gene_type:complete
MKEINKIFRSAIFVFTIFITQAESKVLSIGEPNAEITVKVFSSLTCPHCAKFHSEVFNDLKKDYIDKGLVKFEHHAFPLDLAALNAEIVVRCHSDINTNFKLLDEMYNKQKFWAVGSDINKINKLITKIGEDFGLTKEKINKCLKDDEAQDDILNQRIEAQKKYKIDSTPTVLINEIKYTNKIDYKIFKKVIEKNL